MENILAGGLSYKVDILKGQADKLAETADGVFDVSRRGGLMFSAFISELYIIARVHNKYVLLIVISVTITYKISNL